MIKLHWDPHPATTKKQPPSSSSASASASSSTTSAVAKLLLRWRGRSAVAKDESIEFFSELRSSQPDRGASDHAGRGGAPNGRGKAKSSAVAGGDGGGGGGGKLLSTGTGKHEYDWLLTPPASPLWSPATSAAAGRGVSAASPSRLERASSASYAKGNSRQPLTWRKNGTPASRLARSSSTTSQLSSVAHAPGTVLSSRSSYGRTMSSASVSSINTVSNASVSSTPRGSVAARSPRTPATARSAPAVAAAAQSRHRDRTQALHVFGSVAAGQANASAAASRSRPSPTAPKTSAARPRATPGATTGTSSPRSTTATSQQPVGTRRAANSVARSGSTAQGASPSPRPRDVNLAAGASRGSPPSSSKPRQVPMSGKQRNGNDNSMAAASTTAQRWRPAALTTAVAVAGRNARREEPAAHGSSRTIDSQRKFDVANTSTAARRTVELSSSCGANGGSPTSTGGRNKSGDTDAKRSLWQGAAARYLIAAARRDTTPTRRNGRSSVASRSRLGIMPVPSSGAGSTTPTGRRSTPAKGRPAAAAVAAASPRVAAPDAFPSTRYDAMLLREDPRNLTWLHGCDDDDDDGIGCGGLVEASLESFDVPTGSSSTGLNGGTTLNFGANS